VGQNGQQRFLGAVLRQGQALALVERAQIFGG
jgi:hypothetical protein